MDRTALLGLVFAAVLVVGLFIALALDLRRKPGRSHGLITDKAVARGRAHIEAQHSNGTLGMTAHVPPSL